MRMGWVVGICGLLPLAIAVAIAGDVPRPDPLPLRRVQIGLERVAAELERVNKGTLVLMPRADFEAKVQEAALAVELADTPPRLTRTRFAAQLVGQALAGEAEWSVVQTANGPGVLPLADFNLALSGQPKLNDADAVLGDLDGKTPGLWIARPGLATFHFDWSRRGTPVGDELHFDIQVPPCANAELELKVPPNYRIVANKPGLLVTRPELGTNAQVRTWMISFSGRSQVEFAIRRLETGKALLFAAVQIEQELSANRVLADFEFQVEALHGTVSQLTFDGDVSLKPYEVNIGGVQAKSWDWRVAAPAKGQPGGVLVVPLPEPLDGLLPPVRVRCLAPVMKEITDRAWVSPGLNLRGAVSRGEALELHVLSEAQLESWKPGHFRLIKTTSEADGSQLLTLVDSGPASVRPLPQISQKFVASLGMPERPSALLKARATTFLLEQQSWWQLDVQGSTLTSELICKPSRGQLYHLPLKLPENSQVEQLSVEPKEVLRGWTTVPLQTKSTSQILLIDLAQPATPERPVKLQLQLRLPARNVTAKGLSISLPDIEPQLPCLRETALAVTVHPTWRAQTVGQSLQATAAPEGEGPWRHTVPDFYFAFRGAPVIGQIRLIPRPSRFQARCQSDATIAANHGTLVTRLTIEPTSGSLQHVDLAVAAELAGPWIVRSESSGPPVTRIERLRGLNATAGLLVIGAQSGLEALAVLAAEPGQERWRVYFAQPVRSTSTLVLEAPFEPVGVKIAAGNKGERAWAIPVVTAVAAEQFSGELAVHVAGTEIVLAKAEQLEEVSRLSARPALPRGAQQVWRVYGYENLEAKSRPPRLHLRARAVANAPDTLETCDLASLTTYVEPDGRQVHHFRFRLVNWQKEKGDVPVLLSADSKVLAARTEGRWLPSLPVRSRDGGLEVVLPASAATEIQHFDLYYSTMGDSLTWMAWNKITVSPPQLPVRPLDLRQSWVLPPGVAPLSSAWRRLQIGVDAGSTARDKEPTAGQTWDTGPSLGTALLPEDFGSDWLSWEGAAAVQSPTEIVVVRLAAVRAVGILLSGLLGLLGWVAARRLQSPRQRPWRVRLLLLWVAAAALASLWLPGSIRVVASWPTVAGLALGAVWYFAVLIRTRQGTAITLQQRGRSALGTAALALALGLAAAALPQACSQGTDSNTVLLLPGPPDAPQRQDALVTPDLLKKLDNLTQRGPGGLRGAVLMAANYQGTVAGDLVSFKADYDLHNFGGNAAVLIPLGGVVLLEGALLDGAAVEPVAAAGGYEVSVKNKGQHRLTLAFTVRLQSSPDHRELQFSVPRLFQSQLRLRLPASWPEAQRISGLGVIQGKAIGAQQQELHVDLGREQAVQFRWPSDKAPGAAAKVTVHEAYYWDLRSPGATCTAVLNYSVKGRSISSLKVAVPATLEPRGVEVSGAGSDGADATPPRLKHWQLAAKAGQWQLEIQLQEPASGEMLVILHLVPRHPLGPGTVRLPLPTPLGGKSEGGILGYRVEGLEPAEETSNNLMTVLLAAPQFTRQWQDNGGREAVVPTRAFGFKSRSGDAALIVNLKARRPAIEQDLQWTIHLARVDLLATLKATAAGDELTLLEWTIPPKVTIAEIAGDNIRAWTRAPGAALVQVWLKQPARSVTLNLRGWAPHTEPGTNQTVHWALPWLDCPRADSLKTIVRIVPGGGVRVEPDAGSFANLTALPAPATSAWVCQGPLTRYRAEFLLRAAPQPPRVAAVTIVEALQGKLRLTGQWQVVVPHSGPAAFQVSVQNWQGPPLTLEGPGIGVVISKLDAPPGQQRWQVRIQPNTPRRLQLKMLGVRPCQPLMVVEMPAFHLEGAEWNGRWLAARTPGLEKQADAGLTAVKDIGVETGMPPGAAERLGQSARVWKTTAADWKLSLVVRQLVAAPGLRMLLAEQDVAFGEGFGWIHQTRFWIKVKDGSELTIDMPAGAVLLTASVDSKQVSPRGTDHLAVMLPPGEGLHNVQLRWVLGLQAEPLAMPRMALPQLGAKMPPAVNWTLTVPPGFRLAQDGALRPAPALAAAQQELARARAHAENLQLLAEQWQKANDDALKGQIFKCQAMLLSHCKLAANALERDSNEATAAPRASLKRQLKLLEEQARDAVVKTVGLDRLRSQEETLAAAGRAKASALAGRGKVIRWQTTNALQPQVQLVSLERDSRRQAWLGTTWVLVAVLTVLVLLQFPRAIWWLQLLWPEQVALLAALTSAFGGFTLAPVLLFLTALAARLYAALSFWRRRAAARQPAQAIGASGI